VRPVVAKIEDIDELLSDLEACEVLAGSVKYALIVRILDRDANARAIGELEFMELRVVPPGKGIIDCPRELRIRMTPWRNQQAAWPRPVVFATAFDKINPDRHPGCAPAWDPRGAGLFCGGFSCLWTRNSPLEILTALLVGSPGLNGANAATARVRSERDNDSLVNRNRPVTGLSKGQAPIKSQSTRFRARPPDKVL
jgi:hypothetical protein